MPGLAIMPEYVLKLQKNIFAITVGTSVLLGIALAYLVAVILRLWLSSSEVPVDLTRQPPPRPVNETVFRGVEDFLGIVTGNFIRDAGIGRGGENAAAITAQGEIELMGVLYASPAVYARALVRENDSDQADAYGIGKTVAGYKIVAIHTSAITVDVNGSRFKIKVGEKSGEALSSSPAAVDGAAGGSGEQITLKRDTLQQLMKNPDAIYKNKFSPAIVNGKIAGWKLIYVPNDNFLYQLGARSGDILRRFNGEPLESQEKMIQMWQSLQSANKVTVDIERGGKIFTYDILIN